MNNQQGHSENELPQQPHSPGNDAGPEPAATDPSPSAANTPEASALAMAYARKAGVKHTAEGKVDLLSSAGGIQGLAESILPGLLFLIIITISAELTPALIASLAAAAVFSVIRLVRREPLTTALAGAVGVGISAIIAARTGNASDFYLPGFFINIGYLVAFVVSILVKWPAAGLLFGFIRGEGLHWRTDPQRVRSYTVATWILSIVITLRLVIQLPLYFMGADGLQALGATRLIMGTPLYLLGLWVAWLVTRPRRPEQESVPAAPSDRP